MLVLANNYGQIILKIPPRAKISFSMRCPYSKKFGYLNISFPMKYDILRY